MDEILDEERDLHRIQEERASFSSSSSSQKKGSGPTFGLDDIYDDDYGTAVAWSKPKSGSSKTYREKGNQNGRGRFQNNPVSVYEEEDTAGETIDLFSSSSYRQSTTQHANPNEGLVGKPGQPKQPPKKRELKGGWVDKGGKLVRFEDDFIIF